MSGTQHPPVLHLNLSFEEFYAATGLDFHRWAQVLTYSLKEKQSHSQKKRREMWAMLTFPKAPLHPS